jgi:hypothetical protein
LARGAPWTEPGARLRRLRPSPVTPSPPQCGAQGFGRDRAPLGDESVTNGTRPTGRCLPDVGAVGSSLRETSGRAPRRDHQYVGYNLLSLTRRPETHVAAHRAVAIGENVAPR